MKIIGRIFDGVMILLNIAASLLFICSSYSDLIPPNKIIYFSFLGILFPFFLIPILIFLFYWILRRKIWILIPIITIAVCWSPIKRYFPINVSQLQPTENVVKLITYNTCNMGRTNTWNSKKGNKVINFLKSENPDIICLQEYAFTNKKDHLSEDVIRKELKDYPYYYFAPSAYSHNGGLALFSKYPIRRTQKIDYESLYNTSCLYEIDIKGKRIAIINNHLESNKLSNEDRAFYNEMITHFNSEKLGTFKNTLVSKLATGYRIRENQANKLRSIVDSLDMPVIICGDLNDTPISYCYQHIRGDFNDAFVDTGFGPGISYHENLFLFRIDHIFYSNHFKAYNAKIHKVKYSDHYPVSIYFELKD